MAAWEFSASPWQIGAKIYFIFCVEIQFFCSNYGESLRLHESSLPLSGILGRKLTKQKALHSHLWCNQLKIHSTLKQSYTNFPTNHKQDWVYIVKGSHRSKNTGIVWNTFIKRWPPRTAFMKSKFNFSIILVQWTPKIWWKPSLDEWVFEKWMVWQA